MPKELIYANHEEPNGYCVSTVVGWSREPGHVEIAVQRPSRPVEDAGLTKSRTIGDVLREELTDPKWSNGSNYAEALNTMLCVYEQGWYCQLDRAGINRLIRLLRKARDAAYGSDA